MTRQTFAPPDKMQLREALRGLRFFLRRGSETIAETLNVEALPEPASSLAGAVLREVDGLARSVDGIASDMAKSLLGGSENRSAPLEQLIRQPDSEAAFASAFYVALTSVLRRLGASSVFVSETAARNAIASLAVQTAGEMTSGFASRLTLALQDARVLRGTTAHDAALVPGGTLEAVSIFSVMLWIQSERSEAENALVLDAATDMAVACASEVSAALLGRDKVRIEELFARYVPHV